MNVLYYALVGFHFGFAFALLFAQWTWLELRVNTGLLIVFGTFAGTIYGGMRDARQPMLIGSLSVIALFFTGLLVAHGNLEALHIIIGAMFREGTFMPDLSLLTANGITMGLGVLTFLIAWRHRSNT